MLLLGLDYETTWTEPVTPSLARPIEVGAVLYDTEKRSPVKIYSDMIWSEDHPVSPPDLVALTGLTDEMRKEHGVGPSLAHLNLNELILSCDYVVAHNGLEFDKIVYEAEAELLGRESVEKPWIDTKTDVPYPDHIKTRKLTHLAAEHGFANPFQHRALFDVLTMITVMENYSFEEIINLSKQPNVTAIAEVTFHEKDLAKKRGYYWDGENKLWKKVFKEIAAVREQEEAPFPVRLIRN